MDYVKESENLHQAKQASDEYANALLESVMTMLDQADKVPSEVYARVTRGDVEGAYQQMSTLQDQGDPVKQVERQMQKASLLKLRKNCDHRDMDIRAIYEEGVALEAQHGLAPKALTAYCDYLKERQDWDAFFSQLDVLARRLSQEESTRSLADRLTVIGNDYFKGNRHQEALELYQQARQILEGLEAADPGACSAALARSCNNVGTAYDAMGQFDLARKELLRSKALWEELTAAAPEVCQPDLAKCLSDLGNLYGKINEFTLAASELKRAKELWVQLAADNSRPHCESLAEACIGLGALYKDKGNLAEQEYLQARELLEGLVSDNSARKMVLISDLCWCVGIMYVSTGEYEAAEAEVLRAKEIMVGLDAAFPQEYRVRLANVIYDLGVLYASTKQWKLAERECRRAKEIVEELSMISPVRYLPNLARSCQSLGAVYTELG